MKLAADTDEENHDHVGCTADDERSEMGHKGKASVRDSDQLNVWGSKGELESLAKLTKMISFRGLASCGYIFIFFLRKEGNGERKKTEKK